MRNVNVPKQNKERPKVVRMECDRLDWRNMHPYDRLREGITTDPITAYTGRRAYQEQMLCDEAEPKAWREYWRRECAKALVAASQYAADSGLPELAGPSDVVSKRANAIMADKVSAYYPAMPEKEASPGIGALEREFADMVASTSVKPAIVVAEGAGIARV